MQIDKIADANTSLAIRQDSVLSLEEPPRDPAEREVIGEQLWRATALRFEKSLRVRDRATWSALWSNPPERLESPEHIRLVHAFDDFVLRQFAAFGWRLLMSVGALQRLSGWEKYSPSLLERFGQELARKSRAFRGEKSAPFVEGFQKFADIAIDELTLLLRRMQDEYGQARNMPSCRDIAASIESEIKKHATEFPNLRPYLQQLVGFVQNLPKIKAIAARRLELGEIRASTFFVLWYATAANRSPKDVQNQLAILRRSKRSS